MHKKDEKEFKEMNYMSLEDMKKFVRGIKLHGKNFSKITKDLLPNHKRVCFIQKILLKKF